MRWCEDDERSRRIFRAMREAQKARGDNMGIMKGIGKGFYNAARWFDIFVNFTVGKLGVWSSSGGKKNETISSTMGAEEAVVLYEAWRQGRDVTKIDDPAIPGNHLLGEFSSDLCDLFQKYHSLRSIDWDKEADLEQKYPGIRTVVDNYLKAKGVKS